MFAALLVAAGDDDFVVELLELETALACVVEFDFLPGAGVDEDRAPVMAGADAGAAVAATGTSAGIGSMVMLAVSVGAADVAETVRTADMGALATGEGADATYVGCAAGAGLGETFATGTAAGAVAGAGTCAAAATLGAGLGFSTTGAATAAAGFAGAVRGADATFTACAAGRVAVLLAREAVSAGVSLGSTNGGSPGNVLSGT